MFLWVQKRPIIKKKRNCCIFSAINCKFLALSGKSWWFFTLGMKEIISRNTKILSVVVVWSIVMNLSLKDKLKQLKTVIFFCFSAQFFIFFSSCYSSSWRLFWLFASFVMALWIFNAQLSWIVHHFTIVWCYIVWRQSES